MRWIILITAGIFEVLFSFCLGKVRLVASVHFYLWIGAFLICMSLSLLLLFEAIKIFPLSTAYAVWTGIGTAGTVLLGVFVFKEPITASKIFFLLLLFASIIGLKLN